MSREQVLASLGKALAGAKPDEQRRRTIEARLRVAPRNLVPARGQRPHARQVDLFEEMALAVSATVERLVSPGDVPGAVAGYLRASNFPQHIVRGSDPRLADLPWDDQAQLEVKVGRADGSELVGLSHATSGIAESGTLVLTSGPDNPTSINFLPEAHIVVLKESDIVGDYETMWDALREAHGRRTMPRTVNFVTGPSRSADIEQTLLLGAHGPRKLHILIVAGT